MTFLGIALIFGMLAWIAFEKSVRDANILYAALAFIFGAICVFFLFGALMR